MRPLIVPLAALSVGVGVFLTFPPQDPAAPAYAHEPVVVAPQTVPGVTVPAGDAHVVVPTEVTWSLTCEDGHRLAPDGRSCVEVIEYFEDGSWKNHATGATGCDPDGLCARPRPVSRSEYVADPEPVPTSTRREFEDGSWEDLVTGETGCYPGRMCED